MELTRHEAVVSFGARLEGTREFGSAGVVDRLCDVENPWHSARTNRQNPTYDHISYRQIVRPQVFRSGFYRRCLRRQPAKFDAYLFAYFTGNGECEELIRYAVSDDGFRFKALNGKRSVIDAREISTSGGVRDPRHYAGAAEEAAA